MMGLHLHDGVDPEQPTCPPLAQQPRSGAKGAHPQVICLRHYSPAKRMHIMGPEARRPPAGLGMITPMHR